MDTPHGLAEATDPGAYSALWAAETADTLLADVEQQFASWIRGKSKWDPSLASDGHQVGPQGQDLLIVRRDVARERSVRLRLKEQSPLGEWRSIVTAHESPQGSWVGIRVSNSNGRTPKVPNLAKYLLDALPLSDGGTWLSAEPRRASVQDVEEIAAAITSREREGLYFVAGTDASMPFDAFAEKVDSWTRDARGMAQAVVLDPAATQEFQAIMGASHAVVPWTIRTFDVDVDPAVISDGRRHRILGTRRLAGRDGDVSAILARVARIHAAQRALPSRYITVLRSLDRLEDQLLVSELSERKLTENVSISGVTGATALPQSDQLRAPDALDGTSESALVLVREMLGIEEVSRATLGVLKEQIEIGVLSNSRIARVTSELKERRDSEEALARQRDLLRRQNDDQELELVEAIAARLRVEDEVRWLRGKLRSLGDYAASYEQLPSEAETKAPSDFADLVERLDGLKSHGVIFTGDVTETANLSDHDTVGRVAIVAWECLLTLCDYVRARNQGSHYGGVRHYLDNPPDGYRRVPANKFAAQETRRTMDEWGGDRSFIVPTSVDASGKVLMKAHFKLGSIGMVSPRLYYYDNYVADGNVYVGYIGAHLRNTRTN